MYTMPARNEAMKAGEQMGEMLGYALIAGVIFFVIWMSQRKKKGDK